MSAQRQAAFAVRFHCIDAFHQFRKDIPVRAFLLVHGFKIPFLLYPQQIFTPANQ